MPKSITDPTYVGSKAYVNYIKMLKAGGSQYPIDIVKLAGVDLSCKEPFLAVVNRLTDLVDQLEKLINE